MFEVVNSMEYSSLMSMRLGPRGLSVVRMGSALVSCASRSTGDTGVTWRLDLIIFFCFSLKNVLSACSIHVSHSGHV